MASITDELPKLKIDGLDDFAEVVNEDIGAGYEWDTFAAWYSPSRRQYFWTSQAGCSCNYFGQDTFTLADLHNGDRHALARAAQEWGGEAYGLETKRAALVVGSIREFVEPKA